MTLTCALFVGGESRRMGVDKARLVINGIPLWRRQLEILRSLKPVALMVSARTKPAWCPVDAEIVLDEPPSRGPLTGLYAVLKRTQTTHVLALAVDLPRMEAAHLKLLWSHAQPGCGVLPMRGKHAEPLCAIYPAGEIPLAALKRSLTEPDVSLRNFCMRISQDGCLTPFPISPGDMRFYANANTPEDLIEDVLTAKSAKAAK